ncbi:MAG: bifunctional phosphopantothenoylcysteine decarboxylase/phosphopantothenate--cysteine ligase CoaBC [Syntrophothermus sp.]
MKNDILSGKKIILGVTGGIAAYKACLITRNLVKQGAEVRIIMTPSAAEFITPLTLSTLSGNEVIINVFPESQSNGASLKTWHIEYALWADLMIIAPATVNSIAKIANGFCDNALTTVVSALRCPLLVAPAADMDMYNNPVNRRNIDTVKNLLSAFIVEGEKGELASGLSGIGRMADPEKIIDAARLILSGFKRDLEGRRLLITAGPTFEDLDPVRYIGNRSSGKMGCELAKAAFLRGAEVTLISGPTSETVYPEIRTVKVRSASEMKESVMAELPECDTLIMAAAVADFRPEKINPSKIKKDESFDSIKLCRTDDILASIEKGNKKIVGFALETDNEISNASGKLKSKNLDMIVMNSLKDEKAGFEFDTNKISVIRPSGSIQNYPLQSKFSAANNILSELLSI